MRVERSYAVPPQALLDVLTDEAFLAARSAKFGGSGAPTVTTDGHDTVIRVPRKLPVDAVPGPFRGMVGTGEVVQVDTWSEISDERLAGTWTAEVGSAPLEMRGTHEITATDGGCRYEVTAKVKVKIPFIGGQAEGMVRDRLADLVGKEQEFAAEWLGGAGDGP